MTAEEYGLLLLTDHQSFESSRTCKRSKNKLTCHLQQQELRSCHLSCLEGTKVIQIYWIKNPSQRYCFGLFIQRAQADPPGTGSHSLQVQALARFILAKVRIISTLKVFLPCKREQNPSRTLFYSRRPGSAIHDQAETSGPW